MATALIKFCNVKIERPEIGAAHVHTGMPALTWMMTRMMQNADASGEYLEMTIPYRYMLEDREADELTARSQAALLAVTSSDKVKSARKVQADLTRCKKRKAADIGPTEQASEKDMEKALADIDNWFE